MMSALLRSAVARKEPGVNILLYGPPGTGKTELAKVRAAAGLELYEVEYADRDGNSLSAATAIAAADQPGLPQGSGASRCCSTRSRTSSAHLHRRRAADGAAGQRRRRAPTGSVSGKAWVNQILETTRCR